MTENSNQERPLRVKIFVLGSVVTLVLVGLVFLFVPGEPKENLVSAPLQGPGSVSAALEGGADAMTGAVPSSPLIITKESKLGTPEQNYQRFCAACHGEKGDADAPMARMMTVKPPDLTKGPFQYGRTVEDVSSLIMNGGGVMPGFGRELGEEHATALAKYVLSLEQQEQK